MICKKCWEAEGDISYITCDKCNDMICDHSAVDIRTRYDEELDKTIEYYVCIICITLQRISKA